MRILLIALLAIGAAGCKSGYQLIGESNREKPAAMTEKTAAGPPTLVYKTRADYQNLVPVLLSDDKSQIVSYPQPSDVKTDNGFQTPTALHNGYLLDNRGIGPNVAFLKLTYEEYSNLSSLPTLPELYAAIRDKNPLTELCNCGNRLAFKDAEKEINALIDQKQLRAKCRVVK